MTTPRRAPLDEVDQAARGQRLHLYAPAVIGAAARVLGDLYAAGETHGIDPDQWTMVGGVDLARACLDITARRYRAERPTTTEAATALLDALTDRLHAHGVAAVREGLYVPLPNRPDTPTWGRGGNARLAVSVEQYRGWEFVLTEDRSPIITVSAPFDDGGDAVAMLAISATANKFGNPFMR